MTIPAQSADLPGLPSCTRPADVRIEVYGPDSLDASAYVCREHTADSVTAIEASGRLADPCPVTPGVQRPCGYVYRYATGGLADRVGAEHPLWCDRLGCVDRQQHRSLRLPVSSGRPEAAIAELSLSQGLSAGLEPMFTLAVLGAGGHEVTLSLGQGCVLSYQVRRLLDLTDWRRRSRPRPV